MKKDLKSFFALFVFLTVFVMYATPSFSYDSSAIAKKRKETKAKIFKLKILENRETNKMFKNQQKLETSERELKNSEIELENIKRRLDVTKVQLQRAQQDFIAVEGKAKSRIRSIYRKERLGTFALILSADSFNSFLDRIYFSNRIVKKDKESFEAARENARKISALKTELEREKVNLAVTISDINDRKSKIQSAINMNLAMIKKIQTDRAAYERAERELARQSRIIERMISKSNKTSTVVAATGGFIRPVPGPITSSFGWRIHPIFKSRIYHSGVDIGAAYGTPIKAANSGRVIMAGWNGGYGKVVIIDHGKINSQPISTLYAHQSRIIVSNGQNVNKGQIIGYVGSTGYSTGPHLHYEVRINGKPSNPGGYM